MRDVGSYLHSVGLERQFRLCFFPSISLIHVLVMVPDHLVSGMVLVLYSIHHHQIARIATALFLSRNYYIKFKIPQNRLNRELPKRLRTSLK